VIDGNMVLDKPERGAKWYVFTRATTNISSLVFLGHISTTS